MIYGTSAERFANMFNAEVRRPMSDGLINPREKAAMPVLEAILQTMVPRAKTQGEILTFSVPAASTGQDSQLTYHEATLRRFFEGMGYKAVAINEGLAVIFAELEANNFTGIGISCGGGMCNGTLAYLSIPSIMFSIAKGGDYVDSSAGAVLNEHATRVKVLKEEGIDLSRPAKDKFEKAIHIYYEDLVESLVEALRVSLSRAEKLPRGRPAGPDRAVGRHREAEGLQGAVRARARGTLAPDRDRGRAPRVRSADRHRARRAHRRAVREVVPSPAGRRRQPPVGPSRMPRISVLLAALLLFLAAPVFAIKEWYDYYSDAKAQVSRGRCQEALGNLQEAVRLRPASGVKLRTYGMDFADYFPYFHQGLCHARTGDPVSAIRMFNEEEKQGAIKGNKPLYAELQRQRDLAETRVADLTAATDRQARVKRAAEDVERLRREGTDLHQAGRSEDALARLAQAEKVAAELLDPTVQQQIADLVKRIRADVTDRTEQTARSTRVEQRLAEGRRLLDQGRAAEARIAFDDVLALDQRNAVAQDGRREAQEHIMAETTQQERDAALRRGKALLEAGQYEQALVPLNQAAADPRNLEAAALLKRVQDRLERLRHQKDVRVRIEALLADGERLIQAKQYSEAEVKLRSALELDPGNTLVDERLKYARRMTRDEMIEERFPNQPPVLTLLDPPKEVDGGSLALRGVVTDDRGLASVRYERGKALVAENVFTEDADGQYPKTFRVDQMFELEAGSNVLSVTAVDVKGKMNDVSFTVRRHLPFYQTRAFLPSAFAAAAALLGLVWLAQRARRRRALRRRFNPYIAGAPVMSDELFFGRRKLLARILNVLHHNSLLITGERRIGKTTLLYHLRLALQADDQTGYRFFPVQTDLQGVPEEAFFHTIMSDIGEQLGAAAGDDGRPALPAGGDPLRRARLQPRPAARGGRAQDAHAAAREARHADRRGGRAERVLRARQPAAAQHLHEDVLRAPGRDHERRGHQASVDQRGQPLVQLLRRGRADRVHPRGGGGAHPRAGRRCLPLRGRRRGVDPGGVRPQALPHAEVLHPRGQPHDRGGAHHRHRRGRGGGARGGAARGARRGTGRPAAGPRPRMRSRVRLGPA